VFKPGKTHREVMEYLVGLYREYGLEESQYKRYMAYPFAHLGHGIGLTSSEPPLTRMDNDTPLLPGMTISVEAYLRDEIVFGSEEDILITGTGAEILSTIDTGLYHEGASA
jgi:Xaa-Pro aminopeptidase